MEEALQKGVRGRGWVQRELLNWRAREESGGGGGGLGRPDLQGDLGKQGRVEVAAGALRSSQRTLQDLPGRRVLAAPEVCGAA